MQTGCLGGQQSAGLNRDKQCRVLLSYCNERLLLITEVTASLWEKIMRDVMSDGPRNPLCYPATYCCSQIKHGAVWFGSEYLWQAGPSHMARIKKI